MKRTALALALVLVIFLTSIASAAYYVSVNHSSQGEKSLPTASTTPTASLPTESPSTSFTPPPTSTSTSSSIPGAFAGPLGNFAITSPLDSTYSTNPVTLSVNGQVIVGSNVHLIMTYSLDGQERLPLPVVAAQLQGFAETFYGVITLPELSVGLHSITVFGDLEANGQNLAQDTVSFSVQGS
jgi:hypothetical protein